MKRYETDPRKATAADEYQQSTPSVSSTSTYGASFFNIVYNIIPRVNKLIKIVKI